MTNSIRIHPTCTSTYGEALRSGKFITCKTASEIFGYAHHSNTRRLVEYGSLKAYQAEAQSKDSAFILVSRKEVELLAAQYRAQYERTVLVGKAKRMRDPSSHLKRTLRVTEPDGTVLEIPLTHEQVLKAIADI